MRSEEEILAKYATVKKDKNEALNQNMIAASECGFCVALEWLQTEIRTEEEIRVKLQWVVTRLEYPKGILDIPYMSAFSVVLEWVLEDTE